MTQVNIHDAKTHLSKLIKLAMQGEEVIIAKGNQPLIRLEVLSQAKPKRRIGGAKGIIVNLDEEKFTAPMEDFKDYMP